MTRKFDITKVSYMDLFHNSVSTVKHTFPSRTVSENKCFLKGLHDGMLPFCNSLQDKEDLYYAYSSYINALPEISLKEVA